jgi:hypothetical protein
VSRGYGDGSVRNIERRMVYSHRLAEGCKWVQFPSSPPKVKTLDKFVFICYTIDTTNERNKTK